MKRNGILSGFGALALAATVVAPQALAGGTQFSITGSTQMYSLGSLMAQKYQTNDTSVNITVTPASGQQGFDQTCGNSVPVGMTDMYIQDSQLKGFGCDDMLSVPVAVSAVAVVYNLPGAYFTKYDPKILPDPKTGKLGPDNFTLLHPVRFTADVLAAIYNGKVRKWNDPAVAALNPGMALPAQPIRAFNSAEGGGSGFVFNQWLGLSNADWMKSVGVSITPSWPVGFSTGTTSGGDMANKILSTPYALGFVGFDFAITNRLQAAAIRNAEGVYHTPTLNGVSNAIKYKLSNQGGIASDFRTPFVTVKGADSYNPADFEFWLVHRDLKRSAPNDPVVRKAVHDYLNWTIQTKGGQAFIEQLSLRKVTNGTTYELAHGFVPVPPLILQASQATVNRITF